MGYFFVWICTNQTCKMVNILQYMVCKVSQCDFIAEIIISKYTSTSRLTNLFLDPTGNHLLLTFTNRSPEGASELLYMNRRSNKIRATTKFRGHEFTSVGWNHDNISDSTTGPILLGILLFNYT